MFAFSLKNPAFLADLEAGGEILHRWNMNGASGDDETDAVGSVDLNQSSTGAGDWPSVSGVVGNARQSAGENWISSAGDVDLALKLSQHLSWGFNIQVNTLPTISANDGSELACFLQWNDGVGGPQNYIGITKDSGSYYFVWVTAAVYVTALAGYQQQWLQSAKAISASTWYQVMGAWHGDSRTLHLQVDDETEVTIGGIGNFEPKGYNNSAFLKLREGIDAGLPGLITVDFDIDNIAFWDSFIDTDARDVFYDSGNFSQFT